MKVVLLHDWLTGYRGGERVLEAFCQMFPDAPLYTLIHVPGSTTSVIENRKIKTSFLNNIPGIEKNYRKFLPLFPTAANQLKIDEEPDLIISSSHCVIKGVSKGIQARHISYIHSPMRYIYDQFDAYFGKNAPWWQQLGARIFRPYLMKWDKSSNQNVDLMVANSNFVKKRILEYYNRQALVVHPFVELEDFKSIWNNPPVKENFYLMVGAFAPNKRVDLAISAFNELKIPLKIVGGGQQKSMLEQMAGPNIEFLGNKSRNEIVSLMSRAKGFIFPGVEDFGITPLESMAAGTPVIAFHAGGVLETLGDQVATFFHKQTTQDLIEAIKVHEQREFQKDILISRAQNFSKEIFIEKMESLIEKQFE